MPPETQVQTYEAHVGSTIGTYYFPPNPNNRAVLLVPGLLVSRDSFRVLANYLAENGFLCLAVELPSHGMNQQNFSLGNISRMITESVSILKKDPRAKSVSVVAHSIGAVGAIFSSAGYTSTIERQIYDLWQNIQTEIEHYLQARVVYGRSKTIKSRKDLLDAEAALFAARRPLNQLVLQSLRTGIEQNAKVTSYVLIAPPADVKKAVPGLSYLQKLPPKVSKLAVQVLAHFPLKAVTKIQGTKEINEVPDNDTQLQFLHVKDMDEFLTYFLSMKEPLDYLQLVEMLANQKRVDEDSLARGTPEAKSMRTNFFSYYLDKYIRAKPKLMINGRFDLMTKGLFGRKGMDKLYRACGGTHHRYVSKNHYFRKGGVANNVANQLSSIVMDDPHEMEVVLKFLQKH